MITVFKDGHGRMRNGWWILAFYVLLGALIVPVTIYVSATDGSVSPAIQAVLAAVATGLCLLARREPPASVVGTVASWKEGVPAGLALGVLIWGVVATVLWVSGAVGWHSSADATFRTLGDAALTCIAVAAVEELVFRGFAFQRLIDGVGAWPAQVLMGGYFVLTHSAGLATAGEVKWLATTNIFLASLLFGTVYLRLRSLAIPVSMHFALNFLQGPVLGFGVSGTHGTSLLIPQLVEGRVWWTGGAFGLEASVPGTAAVLLALIALAKWPLAGRTVTGPSAGAAATSHEGIVDSPEPATDRH